MKKQNVNNESVFNKMFNNVRSSLKTFPALKDWRDYNIKQKS